MSDDEDYQRRQEDDEMEERRQHQNVRDAILIASLGMFGYYWITKNPKKKFDHRTLPRPAGRRVFDSRRAYNCLMKDHLAPDALFGKEFALFFRLSRPRVQLILERLGGSDDPHFNSFRVNRHGFMGASLEAKVLLPLKVLAYGVTPYCFSDYFQMSKEMARDCCRKFNLAIIRQFSDEYLRLPTSHDVYSITTLHARVHGVDGMLGSLDCMHTHWKNCPVAWHQSYKGKEKKATVVLEAVADHNLWFWHAAYGFTGSLNDINILNLSPLLRRITDGSFTKIEEDSGVVPFSIEGVEKQFDKCFFLCDGIYPKYSRFVRGMKQPIGEEESRFTAWQESARKDVERAFGVLQCKFKAISSPIHLRNQKAIASMVGSCLILHNMAVSDRVMGDVTSRYDPGSTHPAPEKSVKPLPVARVGFVGEIPAPVAVTALTQFDADVARLIVMRDELKGLCDSDEWRRLQLGLVRLKGRTTRTLDIVGDVVGV